jgi:hypothetical protein
MDIMTVYSTKDSIDEIAKDITDQLGFFDTELLIYFASYKQNYAGNFSCFLGFWMLYSWRNHKRENA